MGFAAWKFLLDIYKRAPKNDGMRPPEKFNKYVDAIAQLNSQGSDQYRKLNSGEINRLLKTTPEKVVSSPNSLIPGA